MHNPKLLFDHDLLWPERGQVDRGARHGFYLYRGDAVRVDFSGADRRPVTVTFGKGYHGRSTVRLRKGIISVAETGDRLKENNRNVCITKSCRRATSRGFFFNR